MTETNKVNQNAEEKPFSKEDVEKRYFAPENLSMVNEYLRKIVSLQGLEIKSNIKIENGAFAEAIPEGFGVLIHPVKERSGKEGVPPVLKAVAVNIVPSLDMLARDGELGVPFLQDAVLAKFEQKINSSIKPRSDGTLPPADSMPRTFEDFVTNRREVAQYGVYSDLAPDFVKTLKKLGFNWINPVVLRQCLQSKAYAAQFTSVKPNTFEKILDTMIATAQKRGQDASILENWKVTRDEAIITEEAGGLDEELQKLLEA